MTTPDQAPQPTPATWPWRGPRPLLRTSIFVAAMGALVAWLVLAPSLGRTALPTRIAILASLAFGLVNIWMWPSWSAPPAKRWGGRLLFAVLLADSLFDFLRNAGG